MTLFQSFKSGGLLYGLLAVVSLLMSTETIAADPSIAKELDRVRTANQALQQVANARLDLETYYLDQIRTLRSNGHASWIELSRQQVLVDSLGKQLNSLQKFDSFVARLENQVDDASGEISSRGSIVRRCTPIKVYLPGSLRLIGWIEPDIAGVGQARPKGIMVSSRSNAENKVIKSAEERLRRAEDRCQAFANSEPAAAQWIQQAELQRDLARAELDFLRLRDEMEPIPTVGVTRKSADPDFRIEDLDLVTPGSQPELQLSTWNVAWAEANTTGQLRSAEIDLRRQMLRASAVEQLHTAHLATTAELKKSQRFVENANVRLQRERERISTLKKICRTLESSEQSSGSSHELKREDDNWLDANCSWPTHVLSDVERVRHLVDLRRHYFDLAGQRDATICKLEMRRTWLEKLKVAAERFSTSVSSKPAGSADLRDTLIVGEKRQIESLQLDIDSFEADIQGFDETLAIMALEERRFIAQSIQQCRSVQQSFVSTIARTELAGTGWSGEPSLLMDTHSDDCRYSYLESRNLNDSYSGITFSCSNPEYLSFTFDCRKGSPLIQTYRYPLSLSPMQGSDQWQLAKPQVRSLSTCPPPSTTSPSLLSHRNRGTYSSRDVYPFGILRSDLRSRAPVGQLPWYLPGSPANLR